MRKIVVNSTPLISLSVINKLDILNKHLGFNITGTLGILIKAKEKGIIRKVKPLIDELIKNNIYINDKLYRTVLKIANETYTSTDRGKAEIQTPHYSGNYLFLNLFF